jgi:hypothetical protein
MSDSKKSYFSYTIKNINGKKYCFKTINIKNEENTTYRCPEYDSTWKLVCKSRETNNSQCPNEAGRNGYCKRHEEDFFTDNNSDNICADTCAICRNSLNEPSIEYVVGALFPLL